MRDFKRLLYLAAGLGMLLYAVPRLYIGEEWTAESVFSVVWVGFALLVIGAQLHFILGVDEEMKQELRRVKQVRRGHLVRALSGQPIGHTGRK